MPSAYIHDGYTRDDGYILGPKDNARDVYLFDPIAFVYRSATREELIRHTFDLNEFTKTSNNVESELEGERRICQFVRDHMISWDVKTAGVHPVELNVANLMRIHPLMFGPIYDIIRGGRASDPKPGEKKSPPTDDEMVGNSERVSG